MREINRLTSRNTRSQLRTIQIGSRYAIRRRAPQLQLRDSEHKRSPCYRFLQRLKFSAIETIAIEQIQEATTRYEFRR